MNQNLINKRKKWYSDLAVKYELLKAMRDREVIFMHRIEQWKIVRGMFIRNIPTLENYFKEYRFLEKDDYNIYVSNSKYKNIPTFTLDLKDRSKETHIWFKESAENETLETDFQLDFDTKLKYMIKLKKEIYNFMITLNYYNVCFRLYPSGKGFHIVISSDSFTVLDFGKIKELIKQIIERFDLKYLNINGSNYARFRIRKCEYSLTVDTVVFPFQPMNIVDINYKKFDCNIILKQLTIKNRGLYNYNDFGKEVNRKNFSRFMIANSLRW